VNKTMELVRPPNTKDEEKKDFLDSLGYFKKPLRKKNYWKT
jgi:hypothetical protein